MLARCLIVSISTPVIRAFFMAEVARGQPERLDRENTHMLFIYLQKHFMLLRIQEKARVHIPSPFSDEPPVGEEASADVARAVTPGCGAGHAISLSRLPRKQRPVHETILLTFCSQWAARRTAMRRVLPSHMTLTVTSRHGTPAISSRALIIMQTFFFFLHHKQGVACLKIHSGVHKLKTYLIGSWSSLSSLLCMILIPLFFALGQPDKL